jgi:curli biogenesis system outer membrane secretion channel CsgG
MNRSVNLPKLVLTAAMMLTVVAGQTLSAQTPAVADARPTLVVMNFESGTVAAKVKDKHGFSAFIAAMRGQQDNEHFDPAELGAGIADMLVEKLLATGNFRLLERKQLDATVREQGMGTGSVASSTPADPAAAARAAMTGARYMVTGSVTKFGFEEHQVGGFAASMATFGMLSVKRHTTDVKLTARVIDVATGEIVAAFDGEGISNKGGGFSVMGIGSNGGGGGGAQNSNFKETAIGEATERAVQNLSEKLEAKRQQLATR